MSAASLYVAELTRRRYRGRVPKPVRGPDDVVALIGERLRDEPREHFVVVLLNARHEAVAVETVDVAFQLLPDIIASYLSCCRSSLPHRVRPTEAIDGRTLMDRQRPRVYLSLLNGSLSTTFTPEIVPVNALRTFSAAVEPTLPAASSAPLAAAEAASSALTPRSLAP